MTIVFYLGIPLFIYVELTFLIGNICLNFNNISINGDIHHGREKTQYPTSINYEDITSIEIVPLMKDSKGRAVNLTRPIPYLILTNKKGKKFRFGLYNMSKKAVRLLLTNLLEKCKEFGGIQFDVDKLTDDFSSARWAVK